jgi:hypothetical protein
MAFSHGIGYIYFIMIQLMAWLSTHIHHKQFFFMTKRVGIALIFATLQPSYFLVYILT